MIHPHTTLKWINDTVGNGVVATQLIPAGTVVWTLCALDNMFSHSSVLSMPKASRDIVLEYSYVDQDGQYVLCWDLGRYVNHSCNPNMMSLDFHSEIAIRDIQPGEELCCDYGVLNYESNLSCGCGSQNCRGTIKSTDAKLQSDSSFLDTVKEAVRKAKGLPQPLLPYVLNPEQFKLLLESQINPLEKEQYFFERPASPSVASHT